MTELINAILDSDIVKVRTILKDEPEAAKIKTGLNELPIELAKKKGLKRIEVLFIRYTNWATIYSEKELKYLLVDLIAELSEDTYCAGWLDKIEFEIWEIINQEADIKTVEVWRKRGDLETVDDLNYLKDVTNSWAWWAEDSDEPIPINLTNWQNIINKKISPNMV